MKKCPACGAEYNVLDAICNACGAELPAPYETASTDDGDGYFAGEIEMDAAAANADALAAILRNTPPRSLTILSGATIYIDDEEITPATVLVVGDRIVEVLRGALPDPRNGATFLDLTGHILTPGFIEIHFHGLMGIDTNQASVDDFLRMSAEAAKHGLTTMTPTTVACSPEQLSQVLTNLRKARAIGFPGARLIGLHLESNFINMEKKGAQPPDGIYPPNDPRGMQIISILDEYQDDIIICTVAPEVEGVMGLIPWLREREIIVSVGHTTANYDQAIAAFEAGATHVTHLFNAMPPLHHREPGVVGAALERDDIYVEMVCDGVHIHPANIGVVITAKGAEHFVPVSDSLQGAGLGEGQQFLLGGQQVTIRGGVGRLNDGTIAGSIVTMDGVLRVLVEQVGWALSEALYLTSTAPADALEMPTLGRLAPGALADFTILSPDLQVTMTMVNGKVVYQK